jgi:hypothetical protein
MRRIYLLLSLFALMTVPFAARAYAQTDDININYGGNTYDIYVPNAPLDSFLGTGSYAGSFGLSGITINENGSLLNSSDTVYFFDSADGGGLWDPSVLALDFGSIAPSSLFNDDLNAPVFSTTDSGTLTDYSDGVATYSTEPAGTPEPSSFLLLGTGAVALMGSFRRRIFSW